MKLSHVPFALLGSLFVSSSSFALVVDFETPTSFESIAQHYNGGADGAGVSGANLGVAFGANALALRNDALGPYFSNAEGLGVLTAVGPDSTMDVAVGFTGVASVLYASDVAVNVGVWSGLGGTGTRLGEFSLVGNSSGCDVATPLCAFSVASLDLGSAVARSITFGESASGVSAVVFDKVTVTAVPEPRTYVLMALGLAALAGTVGRSRRRAKPL